MIGNDLVDLEASSAESNWQRKGWQQKVFTSGEQAMIHHSFTPDTLVWLFWSMKEAAYKLCRRSSGSVSFIPGKFECAMASFTNDIATGFVQFNNVCCHTKSMITPGFIHTSAALQNNLHRTTVFISQSGVTLTYPRRYIFFKDVNGIPYLVDSSSGKVRCASYSHHGRFEALAFLG
jgi:hypothetical protein